MQDWHADWKKDTLYVELSEFDTEEASESLKAKKKEIVGKMKDAETIKNLKDAEIVATEKKNKKIT